MSLIKRIGISTVTAIIIAALHFPVMYGYIHFFINNTHTECGEYAALHFHEKDLECHIFHTLKPGDQIAFTPQSLRLFISPVILTSPAIAPSFISGMAFLPFHRRGPPYFS